jgi:hypothetical protein
LTSEQLEAARAERMRQNGHGAITIEDVRTWIEETGLCIFLPRSAQAGQPVLPAPTATPTFVEAVAGQRINQPPQQLIAEAESLLVRLEAEGVAVRLNLAGQPIGQSGDQPDYVVAGWVLPYIYALRGDRDWRRSPQLTGSRQVSQLAVQAAKHLDSANLTLTQVRDALGREVTETAVLRALHELWKQLRIIPVVPEVGVPALWQPLRQRFQKAIAEGASTSQVTAISVLASIYLQAVIAASMEDIEMFLSPLTSRSKIREVVRGLAATRQVHTTTMGQSPMFYVAGTLPEFPPEPSFQIGASSPAYRSSNYRSSTYLSAYLRAAEEDAMEPVASVVPELKVEPVEHEFAAAAADFTADFGAGKPAAPASHRKPLARPAAGAPSFGKAQPSAKTPSAGKSGPPRPRAARSSAPARRAGSGESRANASGDRRRAPLPRSASANGNGANGARSASSAPHPARNGSYSNGNGSHAKNGASAAANGHKPSGNGHHSNGALPSHGEANRAKSSKANWSARPAPNGGKGTASARSSSPVSRNGSPNGHGSKAHAASSHKPGAKTGSGNGTRNGTPNGARNGTKAVSGVAKGGARSSVRAGSRPAARTQSRAVAKPDSRTRTGSKGSGREPVNSSAAKRYSFTGQAKQAPKAAKKPASGKTQGRTAAAKPTPKAAGKTSSHRVATRTGAQASSRSGQRSGSAQPAKRRG